METHPHTGLWKASSVTGQHDSGTTRPPLPKPPSLQCSSQAPRLPFDWFLGNTPAGPGLLSLSAMPGSNQVGELVSIQVASVPRVGTAFGLSDKRLPRPQATPLGQCGGESTVPLLRSLLCHLHWCQLGRVTVLQEPLKD